MGDADADVMIYHVYSSLHDRLIDRRFAPNSVVVCVCMSSGYVVDNFGVGARILRSCAVRGHLSFSKSYPEAGARLSVFAKASQIIKATEEFYPKLTYYKICCLHRHSVLQTDDIKYRGVNYVLNLKF